MQKTARNKGAMRLTLLLRVCFCIPRNCPYPASLVFYKFILLSKIFINGNYQNGNCNKKSGYGKIE